MCFFFASRRRHTRFKCDWSSDVCFFVSSRRRHTRFKCDWSSDVCSSDLTQAEPAWVRRVEELPDGPMLMMANEFLDALPIRQFVRGAGGWSERMVSVDPEDRLVFVDGPESAMASLLVSGGLSHFAPGTILEIFPAALPFAGAGALPLAP